jgi:hypothetical protein
MDQGESHRGRACPHLTRLQQRSYGVAYADGMDAPIFKGDDGAPTYQQYSSRSLEKLLVFLNERVLAPGCAIDPAPYREAQQAR